MLFEELGDHIIAEDPRDAAVVLCPPLNVLVGVSPKQVAQKACVRNIRGAHHALDLVHAFDLGREAAMHADDLLVDQAAHREAVEDITELLPQLDVVPPLALVVEAVDPGDRRALVVSSKQEEVLGELDLVSEEQGDGLQALFAAVDVVPQEDVVALRREVPVLEDPEQVVILTMDIAANLQRRLELQQRALAQEDLAGPRA
mmetsp:Transcript_54924/g.158939  ORF Transcript_54924/g.158939 Transcript_54924/m.158939 type:complete len:202 (+) Transcript_54924:408-1013(+)